MTLVLAQAPVLGLAPILVLVLALVLALVSTFVLVHVLVPELALELVWQGCGRLVTTRWFCPNP